MFKYIILCISTTLLFTACAERGHRPNPKHLIHKNTQKLHAMIIQGQTTASTKIVVKAVQKKVIQTKNTIVQKPTPQPLKENNKEDILNLSNETKNNISGFFVLVISLIILL